MKRLIKNILFGKPLQLSNNTKSHIALVAIIAWVGLGADGLSSSAYGPEQSFLALGQYTSVAIYLAFATAITVFIIAISYNQIIELFPNGGGGYKVASHLLGPKFGVVSGAALIVDYILTITVSISSGVDALFSLLPNNLMIYKLTSGVVAIIILIILNLRGMKESIRILFPLFLGFLITHLTIIVIGIFFHHDKLSLIIPNATSETLILAKNIGWITAIGLFLRAYSLGGGTYTGLEAVSNNVNMLANPRVRTGKFTMIYMAISLSLTAAGIILLYLLWSATPETGKTLNAVVFNKIIIESKMGSYWLPIILFFEASLLFVAANTGFLACPTVMANMAIDKWLPRQFRELSDRLVTQNGILISGIAAIILLLWTRGNIQLLVVLYSINVFLTFSLSLLGLSIYWIKIKVKPKNWLRKFIIATTGFIVCAFILIITLIEKFESGGWVTILITTCVITFCFFVRAHYSKVGAKLREADNIFMLDENATNLDNSNSENLDAEISSIDNNTDANKNIVNIEDKNLKTAVFFVNKHYGAGIHALLWVRRLFPDVFKNYVFLTSGEIDSENFANDQVFKKEYRKDLNHIIENYRKFCNKYNLPSDGLFSYGTNEIDELIKLTEYVKQLYPDCVFFASKLVFIDESWWTRLLHNNILDTIQRKLHLQGQQMVILPMKI